MFAFVSSHPVISSHTGPCPYSASISNPTSLSSSSFIVSHPTSSRPSHLAHDSSEQSSSHPSTQRQRAGATDVRMGAVLIINPKGGGHGLLSYHLAMEILKNRKHTVAIYNEGKQEELNKKQPFEQYKQLMVSGAIVKYAEGGIGGTDMKKQLRKAFPGQKFDVIIENYSKTLDEITSTVEYAKEQRVSQFVYISSAGIYKKADIVPSIEDDAVSATAGQNLIEQHLRAAHISFTSFRPQYIIGPRTAKREYIDFFFDRISRNIPVPIPDHGEFLTSISHVADVASMIHHGILNKNAKNQIFNVVTDRYISFEGFAKACGKPFGKEVKIMNFDSTKAKAAGVDLKKAFPFRVQHFITSPGKAMQLLDWEPQVSLDAALKQAYDEYMANRYNEKEKSFPLDQQLASFKLEKLKTPAVSSTSASPATPAAGSLFEEYMRKRGGSSAPTAFSYSNSSKAPASSVCNGDYMAYLSGNKPAPKWVDDYNWTVPNNIGGNCLSNLKASPVSSYSAPSYSASAPVAAAPAPGSPFEEYMRKRGGSALPTASSNSAPSKSPLTPAAAVASSGDYMATLSGNKPAPKWVDDNNWTIPKNTGGDYLSSLKKSPTSSYSTSSYSAPAPSASAPSAGSFEDYMRKRGGSAAPATFSISAPSKSTGPASAASSGDYMAALSENKPAPKWLDNNNWTVPKNSGGDYLSNLQGSPVSSYSAPSYSAPAPVAATPAPGSPFEEYMRKRGGSAAPAASSYPAPSKSISTPAASSGDYMATLSGNRPAPKWVEY